MLNGQKKFQNIDFKTELNAKPSQEEKGERREERTRNCTEFYYLQINMRIIPILLH